MKFEKDQSVKENNNQIVQRLVEKLNDLPGLREAYGIMDNEGVSYVVNPDGLIFVGQKDCDTLVLGQLIQNSFHVTSSGGLGFSYTKFGSINKGEPVNYEIKEIVSHDGLS